MRKNQEYELVDRLKHENARLKRELKRARKALDRYAVAEEKGLIDQGVVVPSKKRQLEKEMKERWACHSCETGILRLIILGNRYFRKCDNCAKHTKSQIWDSSVTGIK
jgi:hypothetical protein